jgi:hypothetical protein
MVLSLLVMQSACDTSTYIDVTHVHKQALYQVVALYDTEYWGDY